MRLPNWLLSVALLMPGTAFAAAAVDASVHLHFRAAITIAPDGSLSWFEWRDGEKIPAALRERLAERVRTWQFDPGAIDGQPAETETTLRISLLATPQGDGYGVRIENADTGPSVDSIPFPDYPPGMIRRGGEAELLAALVVDADGERHVTLEGYEGRDVWRKHFLRAMERVLLDATIHPERVGGFPVVARFS